MSRYVLSTKATPESAVSLYNLIKTPILHAPLGVTKVSAIC